MSKFMVMRQIKEKKLGNNHTLILFPTAQLYIVIHYLYY